LSVSSGISGVGPSQPIDVASKGIREKLILGLKRAFLAVKSTV